MTTGRTTINHKENGYTVVITGGTGGLGQTVTSLFLEDGWKVLTTYTDPDHFKALADVCAMSNPNLDGVQIDITQAAGADKLAEYVRREYPDVRALVNLVGGFAGGSQVIKTSESVWDRMMLLNLKTVFLAVKAIAPVIISSGGGSIVNTGSRAADDLGAGLAAYGVSKNAVLALTKVLAKELDADGVRVNCVLPDTIDTPANRRAMPEADFSQWVSPRDVAQAILFLAGERSGSISGANLPVYGGIKLLPSIPRRNS